MEGLSALQSFKSELFEYLDQGAPLIWIDCFDYQFLTELFDEYWANKQLDTMDGVLVWDPATGERSYKSDLLKEIDKEKTLAATIKSFDADIYRYLILKEPWAFENNLDAFYPMLMNFHLHNSLLSPSQRKSIVIISSTSSVSLPSTLNAIHSGSTFEINKLFRKLVMPYPDAADIEEELGLKGVNARRYAGDGYDSGRYRYADSFMKVKFEVNKREMITALSGMCIYDIRRVMSSIMRNNDGQIALTRKNADNPKLTKKTVTIIAEEKRKIVQDSGLLEVINVPFDQNNYIGNIDGLREYLEKQKIIIDNIAQYPSGLPRPKGILLVGPPGTGKSVSAKAVASIFGLPLLRLDIGTLMGQYVGQSEHNLMAAIRIAEAAHPCVLWIDEIEKAFAGMSGQDGGNDITVTRMIGYFLTWMQEKKSLVYLVATANNLDNLKPEFLRKGRWDEIFYLSYPDQDGVLDIMKKCLNKYRLQVVNEKGDVLYSEKEGDARNLQLLAKMIFEGELSGADIESIIISAYNMNWLQHPTSVKIAEMLTTTKEFIEKKHSSQRHSEKQIEQAYLDIVIQFGGDVPYEDDVRKALEKKYKGKSNKDLEELYSSKGYIPANKKRTI